MTIDITQIIVALIGVAITIIGAVITRVVVPWIKANTSETVQAVIETAAEAAVYAAQQLCGSESATIKKEYAVDYVTAMLVECGLSVDEAVISSAIEAALKAAKIGAGDAWTA